MCRSRTSNGCWSRNLMPGDLHWLACRWVRRAWRVHPVASNPSPCRWSAMMDLPRPSRSTDGGSQTLSLTWGRTRTRGECPYPSIATELEQIGRAACRESDGTYVLLEVGDV